MFILLDADKSILNTKDLIKGTDQIEKVQRTKDGDYSLQGPRKSLLTEHEDKPVTRITFIGHSAFEEDTGIQCYGGYDADDFADLLILRLNKADEISAKEFSRKITSIDLIGCVTGYVSRDGKSFAGRVAERLLAAGYDIRVNAFTNMGFKDPHAIYAMISAPQVAEGKFYIRGFSSASNYEKYEKFKEIIAENIEDKKEKELALLTLQEEIAKKEKDKERIKENASLSETQSVARKYQQLKKDIDELKEKLSSPKEDTFSLSMLISNLKLIGSDAKKTKWKNKIESMNKDVEKLNSQNKNTEQEKIRGIFNIINRTVKDIHSHFFIGRRNNTANTLQELIDDRQAIKSFDSLKSLLHRIHQDAMENKSKWRNKTATLIGKIERIDDARTNNEKLAIALNLINETAKDIRGHFFGGKGSTIATRLEKIMAKQDDYLKYASEQQKLREELEQKRNALKRLNKSPAANKLKGELQLGKEKIVLLDKEIQSLKQEAQNIEKEINILDEKIGVNEKKRLSFTVEVASTNDVRNYLDTHNECNFTLRAKNSKKAISQQFSFFKPDSSENAIPGSENRTKKRGP